MPELKTMLLLPVRRGVRASASLRLHLSQRHCHAMPCAAELPGRAAAEEILGEPTAAPTPALAAAPVGENGGRSHHTCEIE